MGLTPEEKKLYSQIFKALSSDGTGIVTGEKARSTFEKSGLPPNVLGEIWQIADPNNLGFLTQFSFCYAMRLIGYTQAGQHPTTELGQYPGPLPKFSNLNSIGTLQPQSTDSSLLKTQPSSFVPSNVVPPTTLRINSVKPVSSEDVNKFGQLFVRTVGSANGELNGMKAKDIFMKAKLPTPVLGQIWNLVDKGNLGNLSITGFIVAMHLIQGLLSGEIKELPSTIPDNIWYSVNSQLSSTQSAPSRQFSNASVSSQQTTVKHPVSAVPQKSEPNALNNEWIISPSQKKEFDSIFESLDKAKNGKLNPDQVASFLMTSNLSQNDLATIWDLADVENTGIFSKLEFSIALYLVNKRLSGESLPNIVPPSLLDSIRRLSESGNEKRNIEQPSSKDIKPIAKQNTALDDLADVFNSTSSVSLPHPKSSENGRTSSFNSSQVGDNLASGAKDVPKVHHSLTGSFKPASTFGQELMKHQTPMIEEKATDNTVTSPKVANNVVETPKNETIASPSLYQDSLRENQKSVNYDALRSVPPPPPKASTSGPTIDSNPLPPLYQAPSKAAQPANVVSENAKPPSQNEDLLADSNPEISGKLSQATSDIANISNQVKSLTTQTSTLHERKTRAEQELNKILNTKGEIEQKLKSLRLSYDHEVQQFELVGTKLANAKEESEALRSEASISEAKLNHLTSKLRESEESLLQLQKENTSLKEKVAVMNSEISDKEKILQNKSSESEALSKKLAVKRSQLQVIIVNNEDLKSKIAEIESKIKTFSADIAEVEEDSNDKATEAGTLQDKLSSLSLSSGNKNAAKQVLSSAAGASGNSAQDIDKQAHDETTNAPPFEAQKLSQILNLVDEVKQNPSADMTGIDDLNEVDKPELNAGSSTPSTDDNEYNLIQPKSVSELHSNSNIIDSEFPGAYREGASIEEGLETTDNKPSQQASSNSLGAPGKATKVVATNQEDSSDGDKISSGVESFEMVNAEDAKGVDVADQKKVEEKPESQISQLNNIDEEFPPIKELDYDEGDSSSDSESQTEEFDDAVDNLQSMSKPDDSFGNAFDDLEPAKEDNGSLFEDEFDNLVEAKDDENLDNEFSNNPDVGLSNNFTSEPLFQTDPDTNENLFSDIPSSSSQIQNPANDEWEQLFAGFGNGTQSVEAPKSISPEVDSPASTSHQAAIQELVGMGFEEQVVNDALNKTNWDIEAATNYLLDNA